MHSSLQNITAITIIVVGLILGLTTFDNYLYNYHTRENTQIIIKTMVESVK